MGPLREAAAAAAIPNFEETLGAQGFLPPRASAARSSFLGLLAGLPQHSEVSDFLIPVQGRTRLGRATAFTEDGMSLEERVKFLKEGAPQEMTKDGFRCAPVSVKNGEAFAGCTDTIPAPDGTVDKRWCYLRPEEVSDAGRNWGFCRKYWWFPDAEDILPPQETANA